MKKDLCFAVLIVILLVINSCYKEPVEEVYELSETEMRFLNLSGLKSGNLTEKQQFIDAITADLEKQNKKKRFIKDFAKKYGYPDWEMVRWFVANNEVVAQIPVLHDNDYETKAVILCVKYENKLNFKLFVRNKFEKYTKNKKPKPTAEKIKDLFIIFDFQRFGESNYLPNGVITSDNGKEVSTLKAYYEVEIETCYFSANFVGGELIRFRADCESHYVWRYVNEDDDSRILSDWGTPTEWFEEGSGTGVSSNTNPIPEPAPAVYVNLKNNPKADCIYDKLIKGNIMQDFIKRYFGVTEPNQSFLGELNLTWNLGSTTQTIPIGIQENKAGYSVEIQLNEAAINSNSSTNVALSMLHEALHAKLIAEFYDEVESTDFKALYAKYKGWGLGIDKEQEKIMYKSYFDDIANALKKFDECNGVVIDIEDYKKAVRYDFIYEIYRESSSKEDNSAYESIFVNSTKNCY